MTTDIYNDDQHKAEEQRIARLASFAATIVQKRTEAVSKRKESGIEDQWREDEEYYEGIDAATKSETKWLKPSSLAGTPVGEGVSGGRSTVFVNITQPYVDMAAARVADMLLPTDDKPFAFKPTPIPDLDKLKQSAEPMPDGQMTKADAATQYEKEATEKAEKAETQVWDWLCESRWHTEMRKVIEQKAKIGTSCLKGPFPVSRKARKVEHLPEGIQFTQVDVIKPGSKYVDIWNIYPDPSCGDNIHNGSFIFEKDKLSARQLLDLRGAPGYIESEIDSVIKEGPAKCNQDGSKPTMESDQFDVWYFHGFASAEDLRSAGMEIDEGEMLPISLTLVNDRIVKASLSVFDSGAFPYDVAVWKRRTGSWTGKGVARQVRTAQRIVNGAARNMMDNAGVASGPQIILKAGTITPQDGQWAITPMKIWLADENADLNDVRQAFTSVVIPMLQAELENIIKMGLDLAERATSMPLIMQGQQGNNTQTVGGMTLLQNNSSSVLRNIAKIVDDDVIEPHVLRYYDWNMIYGEDDATKGDFTVQALGSSAFYERDAQNQVIMQLLPMAGNPAFELSPKRMMIEVLKMNKITPERVRMTEEEIQQLQQQPQPKDPAIEVATIRAQTDMQKAQLIQQSDQAELQKKDESMQSEFALKIQLQEAQQEHEMRIESLKFKMKLMELAQERNLSIDEIKAQLATDSLKINTQKELSVMNQHAKQVSNPPTEPVGRAATGRAFEQ